MACRNKILVTNGNDYLSGALEALRIISGYSFKQFDESDPECLLGFLRIDRPRLVLMDLSKVNYLLNSNEWKEIRALVENYKIVVLGIGKLMGAQNDIRLKSNFVETFEEPLKIEKIIQYIGKTMTTGSDGKIFERRKGWDRRAPFELVKNDRGVGSTPNTLPKQARIINLTKVQLDYKNKTIAVNGKQFETSPKEFSILNLLIKNKGAVVKTEKILETVWTKTSRATQSDVHQYIYLLRKKLEKNSRDPKLLVTVKGFGYKLGS